jgi:hypothetical protein
MEKWCNKVNKRLCLYSTFFGNFGIFICCDLSFHKITTMLFSLIFLSPCVIKFVKKCTVPRLTLRKVRLYILILQEILFLYVCIILFFLIFLTLT